MRRRKRAGRRVAGNARPFGLAVARLGGRGDGVGQAGPEAGDLAGRDIFVPFTLPGERVLVRPVEVRADGVAATALELEQAAANRVEPACDHFMACGGCALQHLAAADMLDWKGERVRRHLARVGLAAETVAPIAAATDGGRRRAGFVLRRVGSRILAGFHERASNRIVDLRECPVSMPELVGLLEPLRRTMAGLLESGAEAGCAVNWLENGPDLLLTLPGEPGRDGREALAALAETADLSRLSIRTQGDETPAPLIQRRRPLIRFAGIAVTPPPGAFLQATAAGEAAIVEAVLAAVRGAAAAGRGEIIDLFAGCGTLSCALARLGRVRAFDADAAAIAALAAAARSAGLAGLTAEQRDLTARPLRGPELEGCDALVLDPPRSGARPQIRHLARAGPALIVYVSCNPASFARDARMLADGGYRLDSVQPIDQFRWSPHVELVAAFRRP